jgi:hypothetical protein
MLLDSNARIHPGRRPRILKHPYAARTFLSGMEIAELATLTIRLERFVQTLYNSKVSESVEELLELC